MQSIRPIIRDGYFNPDPDGTHTMVDMPTTHTDHACSLPAPLSPTVKRKLSATTTDLDQPAAKRARVSSSAASIARALTSGTSGENNERKHQPFASSIPQKRSKYDDLKLEVLSMKLGMAKMEEGIAQIRISCLQALSIMRSSTQDAEILSQIATIEQSIYGTNPWSIQMAPAASHSNSDSQFKLRR